MSSSAGRLHGSRLSLRRFVADVGPIYAANGLIGLLLAATAPTAIVLSVSTGTHLPASELASWIFGIFFPTD